MKKVSKRLKYTLVGLAVLVCVAGLKSCYNYASYSRTAEYELAKITGDMYGYYNVVKSNVPAENYECITLYFKGQVRTLDGTVNIHYSNDEHRLVWTKTHRVHGDTMQVYVPYGSIEIRPSLVHGR